MNRGRDKYNKLLPIIKLLIKLFSILPRKLTIKFFNSSRLIRGNLGLLLRFVLIKNIAKNCGDNVSVHPGVYLFNINKISFGSNVSIHPMCYIDGAGEIEIGSDVSIAHGVTIMSSEHVFEDMSIPIKDQGIQLLKTKIENNVWIGAKSSILGGVTIEEGSIVAAGAVINKNIARYTIVGGVPGKKIKERKL